MRGGSGRPRILERVLTYACLERGNDTLRDVSLGGMIVAEGPGADSAIVPLASAVTAFVGRTLRGPVNRPVAVKSFAEFHQVFGGLWQPSTLSYAVEQFFECGGQRAVVVRVVNGGAPATISLPCGGQVLTLAALSPGSRESLRAASRTLFTAMPHSQFHRVPFRQSYRTMDSSATTMTSCATSSARVG